MTVFDAVICKHFSVHVKKHFFRFCTVYLHTRCEMRHFYTLRCPAPFWLIQCKPYRNRFIIAKVIDKRSGARFYGPLCTNCRNNNNTCGMCVDCWHSCQC